MWCVTSAARVVDPHVSVEVENLGQTQLTGDQLVQLGWLV